MGRVERELAQKHKIDINFLNELFYTYDGDDSYYALLEAINTLDETEKRILLIYSEYQSYDCAAKVLGVSITTVYKKIVDIRTKIKKQLTKQQ